jgi:hypothetical protein
MSTSVNIWDRPEIVDALDLVLENGESTDLVLAQIPGLFGESAKATYLGFRAIGLTRKQALEVLQLDSYVYEIWKAETPEFAQFEYKCLTELQSKIGADIVRLGFLRNMTMFLFRDQITIRKSLSDFEGMSNRDFAYLRAIRRHYSNSDLLALEKAISPERHRNNTLVLSFGNDKFEILDDDEGGLGDIKLIEGGSDE